MAIKNRDGSIYCFSKPNPLMNSQSIWPKNENVILHNKIGQRFYGQGKEINVVEEKKVEKMKEVVIVTKAETSEKHVERDVIDVWCLPAEIITKIDPLYGSNYNRIKYGEKFSFEAKIYETEDLYLQLITKQKLPENSVIFPRNKDRRWWRVSGTEKYEGDFWIVTSQISDYQPNFVD